MLEVKNLVKKYGDFTAVDGVSFNIERGEIFGFLGPNGAGKTTTIKMLTGLLKPTSGEIIMNGQDLLASESNFKNARRTMGYIPDTPNVYEKLTGWEFLKFVSDIFERDWEETRKIASQYLKRFNIFRDADSLIETYSHGMRQKLVFTSALIHKPELLIVDEPMIGLDPKNVKVVKQIFREISEGGGTIFLSTHTLAVAEEVCSKIAIIFHGKIIALDEVDKIKKYTDNMGQTDVLGKNLEEVFLKLTEESEEEN
ncbi:MAG TPA: ABC transporter ATP-binding protein [Candidatus Wallbacteria bacterium]|nr:ABC transporter ATP-binding protein [Candidatus Wallbacteria bacterium]